jgi:transglutaminase-like putative cysteine protease
MRDASPDRRTVSSRRVWTLTALVGVQVWAALDSLPSNQAATQDVARMAAVVVAVLAVFGLRSVPLRHVVRGMTLLTGLLLARFGELGVLGGIGGSWRLLAWLGAMAAAMVLAPSSRSVPGTPPGMVVDVRDLSSVAAPGELYAGDRLASARWGVSVTVVVAAVALLGGLALLVGPRASLLFPAGSGAGDLVDLGDNRQDNVMVASDQLDMTTRPRLTDRIVLTVRSPLASFWRTETFDEWDGARWTRSRGAGGEFLTDGRVVPAPDDLAAREGVTSTQEFRVEVGFATAVPLAPSAVRVDSEQALAQRNDGSLVSPVEPLGRGATYTVQSAQVPTDPEQLRASAADDAPAAVVQQFAQPPVATERTVALARRITAGIDNDYDKVRAIEQWMDENTRYSLDAPLAPQGVDVVDDFLFESRLGWCEQIASSLVVMARLSGVPARLATGFTPGEWDAVGGRFIVRERNAHAWAEVWFPDTGWVTFDPTAEVPLAGTPEATPGAAAIDWREVGGVALVLLGAVVLFGGLLLRRLRRGRSRWRRRRAERAALRRWDVAAERRIEQQGAAAGRPRGPAETLTRYSQQVSVLLEDPAIAESGAAVERYRYGPAEEGSPADETADDRTDPHDSSRVVGV